jgi:hypothetical protein
MDSWSSEERDNYLLKQIDTPLSVSRGVWPECTIPEVFEQVFHEPKPVAPRNGLDVYSLELPALRNPHAVILAITAEHSIAMKLLKFHKIDSPLQSTENLRSSGFRFIGYDVADLFLCSGLMYCRFEVSEQKSLRVIFNNKINQYGLFTSPIAADKFLKIRARQVSEHAPFYKYGMWIL